MKLKLSLFLLLAVLCGEAIGQTKWYNPVDCEFNPIEGIGLVDQARENPYNRVPDRIKEDLREAVWFLSTQSAGLTIKFRTNSPNLTVRYQLKYGEIAMPHMPATGVSGLDMYGYNAEGETFRVVGMYNFKDTVSYNYSPIEYRKSAHDRGYEYELYLPTYNGVKWLEIGVDQDAFFEFSPRREDKPIVVYGTSIAQGGCASRPAMIWTSMLKRALDMPLINLGFSGNGMMEEPLIDMIGEIDAAIYILDCMPNLQHLEFEKLTNLIYTQVKRLREARPETPIILVDHLGYSISTTQSSFIKETQNAHDAQQKALAMLAKDGVDNLHLIDKDELNMDFEGVVDYVHPNDIGMKIYSDVYEKWIRKILDMPKGDGVTTTAVRQRREPATYEWMDRHASIVKQMKEHEGETVSVVIGNSIIHHWGGVDGFIYQRGDKVWDDTFGTYINMGCGWDRTENLIWRLERGELDFAHVDEAFLKIGVNNISNGNNDEEIVKGIDRILDIIHNRQGDAKIVLCGILPSRNREQRTIDINKMIKALAAERDYVEFLDLSNGLVGRDGKLDEKMFVDGLHPSEAGYKKIAKSVEKYRKNK